MGACSSELNEIEGTHNIKRRRGQKNDNQSMHIAYDSLKGYGYHFKSKVIY
jgi:hypothetical protein